MYIKESIFTFKILSFTDIINKAGYVPVEYTVCVCVLPFSSSMSAGMMPDLANMAAQASSMETVPIIITTSRMRSSSAVPITHTYLKD